jgi:putative pyruvate formate lyase activating enzyme
MNELDSIKKLYFLLSSCYLCPLNCGAGRLKGEIGKCNAHVKARISSYMLYKGEEPPLSGSSGSGAIFFSNCNLKCVYCQNYNFSQLGNGHDVSQVELSSIMFTLEKMGAVNINLITATHYLPQAASAIIIARSKGLSLPIVLNTSGYESQRVINLLSPFIDIYLVDYRYASDELGVKYSDVPFYTTFALSSIKEMLAQKPYVQFDKRGIMREGVVIRLLVFPTGLDNLRFSLKTLKEEFGNDIYISLMSQYVPVYKANLYPEIARKLTKKEMSESTKIVKEFGFKNGWVQYD